LYDELPVDPHILTEHKQRQASVASPKPLKPLKPLVREKNAALMAVAGIGAIVAIWYTTGFGFLLGLAIPLVIAGVIAYQIKIVPPQNEQIAVQNEQIAKDNEPIVKENEQIAQENAKEKADLEAFEAQWPTALQRFKSEKKALRGIYEGVSGDTQAF
jgi:predicted lipid-binding transport protein (Tim44 family)